MFDVYTLLDVMKGIQYWRFTLIFKKGKQNMKDAHPKHKPAPSSKE